MEIIKRIIAFLMIIIGIVFGALDFYITFIIASGINADFLFSLNTFIAPIFIFSFLIIFSGYNLLRGKIRTSIVTFILSLLSFFWAVLTVLANWGP